MGREITQVQYRIWNEKIGDTTHKKIVTTKFDKVRAALLRGQKVESRTVVFYENSIHPYPRSRWMPVTTKPADISPNEEEINNAVTQYRVYVNPNSFYDTYERAVAVQEWKDGRAIFMRLMADGAGGMRYAISYWQREELKVEKDAEAEALAKSPALKLRDEAVKNDLGKVSFPLKLSEPNPLLEADWARAHLFFQVHDLNFPEIKDRVVCGKHLAVLLGRMFEKRDPINFRKNPTYVWHAIETGECSMCKAMSGSLPKPHDSQPEDSIQENTEEPRVDWRHVE